MAMLAESARKYISGALDAAFLSPNSQGKGTLELVKQLVTPVKGKRDRFQAAINLGGKLLPGLEDRLARAVVNQGNLPVSDPVFIANGGEQYVYRISPKTGEHVFKINRAHLGKTEEKLLLEAKKMQFDHKLIQDWYSDIPIMIPSEHFLVINSPIKSQPSVGVIQPFVDGAMHGVFETYTPEGLARLLRENLSLREAFVAFAGRFNELLTSTQTAIDIMGKDNLCIREAPTRKELVFLDAHTLFHLHTASGEAIKILNERLKHMRNTLSLL